MEYIDLLLGWLSISFIGLSLLSVLLFLITLMFDNSKKNANFKSGYADNVLPSTFFGSLIYALIFYIIGWFISQVSTMPDFYNEFTGDWTLCYTIYFIKILFLGIINAFGLGKNPDLLIEPTSGCSPTILLEMIF